VSAAGRRRRRHRLGLPLHPGPCAGVSTRIVSPLGETMPADGKAVGELDVRVAVGELPGTSVRPTRLPTSSATAGCAPVTSEPCRPTGS
jgi:hypothetical protein